MADDQYAPIEFGYKTSWWVVKSSDTDAVCEATDAVEVDLVPWQEGFEKSYEKGIFISPPIGEWTFMHGADSDLHFMVNKLKELADRLVILSRPLGEAQFFFSHRVNDAYIWARAIEGKLDRFFAFVGDTNEILWNAGNPTEEERTIFGEFVSWEFEFPEEDDEKSQASFEYPDEDRLLQLAASWSFDPSSLDSNPAVSHESARYARWNLISGIRRPRNAPKKAPPKTLVDLINDRKFAQATELLEAGADANERTGELHLVSAKVEETRKIQETPLLALCCTIPVGLPLIENAIDLMWKLLDAGADIEAAGPLYFRPIHWACWKGCPSLLQALIEAGANTRSRDVYADTPLHRCHPKRSLERAKLLVEAGADVKAANDSGTTPLWGMEPESIRYLVSHGADVNHVSKNGRTPLHHFVHVNQMEAVEILLELGANPKLPASADGGATPLQMTESRYAKELSGKTNRNPLTTKEIEQFEAKIKRLKTAEAEWDAKHSNQ